MPCIITLLYIIYNVVINIAGSSRVVVIGVGVLFDFLPLQVLLFVVQILLLPAHQQQLLAEDVPAVTSTLLENFDDEVAGDVHGRQHVGLHQHYALVPAETAAELMHFFLREGHVGQYGGETEEQLLVNH
jgi:hypothetical protein